MAQLIRLAPESDLAAVRCCMTGLRELLYEKGVPLDSFQDFEKELSGLPGQYGDAAGGCILVACTTAGSLTAMSPDASGRLEFASVETALLPPTPLVGNDTVGDESGARAEAVPAEGKSVVLGCVALKDISYYEGVGEHVKALISAGHDHGDGSHGDAATDGRPLRVCEMKRLFVPPAARRSGAGRALSKALLEVAAAMGYDAMLLDTLDRLPEACALYEALGFVRTGAYVHNPMPDVRFYGKMLR